MDWRNDESDHSSVENFTWDEKNLLTKTKSDVSVTGAVGCNVCCQGVQANFGICKESRSFTSAFERLELEAEIECRNETIPLRRTSDAQTEPLDDIKQELYDFDARDILPCRQALQHSDILNFQGVRYPSEDIARYWKKDSRMWLWKSVRLMRRQNECKSSSNACATDNENEEKD
ncbi:uncharacterized protein LOC128887401 [Hylaeus anthracinus]|uniref:uncharacterized protein LOC128877871 n=1 Tax=Hylaeus volcanicus TaxID=313075 RepID=UPI0023B83ACF|nr:uncharacterized protein LOC128877871 [Hylaeus volcanicus]XP_053999230.1 uncharacterized protein LOC128887401 [Hylaeus anthracinus]